MFRFVKMFSKMKKITGYENYYISEYGEITNYNTGKVLKNQKNKKGYYCIMLCSNGISKTFIVSRLVYSMYVGALKKGMDIDHIDGNKENNHYTNLQQITRLQNVKNAVKNGLIKSGDKNIYSKQLQQINPVTNEVIKVHGSIWEATRYMNKKSPANISQAANGKRKTSYGFKWKII